MGVNRPVVDAHLYGGTGVTLRRDDDVGPPAAGRHRGGPLHGGAVADFTYVRLATGVFVYTAFAIDAYAGRIVGWEWSASKHDRFVRSAIRQAAALRSAERHPPCGSTIHHCMGGRTSMAVAGLVPERVAAAMSFHGGGLAADDPGSPHLLADRIQAAMYVGAAENDPSYTREQSQTLQAALTEAGVEHLIEWYSAGHGFAVTDNGPYDQQAAEKHWRAMEAFFGDHLPAD